VSAAASAASAATAAAGVAGIQAQVDTIDGEITALQNQTQYLSSSTAGNYSRFTTNLRITNGVTDNITLSQNGNINSVGGLTCNSITSSTIASSNTITASNAITGGSFVSTGGLTINGALNVGTAGSTVHNISGLTVNINALYINLNGIVSMPTNFFTQW
jgi:hypothetical protein